MPTPGWQAIELNLWLQAPGKPMLVCIDFVKADGLYCSKWQPDGCCLGLFHIEHEHAQQSFLQAGAEFIDPPEWSSP